MDKIKSHTYKSNSYLFRANEHSFAKNGRASNNYRGAPMKYFTLNEREVNTYTRFGKPYVKTWEVTEDLNLVDILDLNTRKALGKIPELKESIDIAFPIKQNKVSRRSEEHTKHHDDNVLKIICDLGYDGYYMKNLTNNNKYVFHSEVGLCPKAYHKLKLEKYELKAAPKTRRNNNSTHKKSRSRFTQRKNNNNNNNVGMYFSPPPQIRPRGSLF